MLFLLAVACTPEPTDPTKGPGTPEPEPTTSEPTGTTTTEPPGTTTFGTTGDTGAPASTGDTGPTTTPPLGAPTIADRCSQPRPDALISGVLAEPELHLFGVYQPVPAAAAGLPGPITIELLRPVETWIALSSYEAAEWTLVVNPGASVAGVFVNGYEPQIVHVVDTAGVELAVPVDDHSPHQNSIGYYPCCLNPGYYTDEVNAWIALAESELGVTSTAFWGCYESAGFRLQ